MLMEQFRLNNQSEGETLKQFVTALQELASICAFSAQGLFHVVVTWLAF